MEANLDGCEIICIGEQGIDLTGCPLSEEGQAKCLSRKQYLAGIKAGRRMETKSVHIYPWALSSSATELLDRLGPEQSESLHCFGKEAYNAGKMVGKRGVVEWVNSHIDMSASEMLAWQSQLKRWG